jgi:hypothetical protein
MGELIPIFAILMVFSIPLAAILTHHRRETLKQSSRDDSGEVRQLRAENRELEDRLRVLERIVTDKGYDVATQIEALRDSRRIDDELTALEDRRDPSRN